MSVFPTKSSVAAVLCLAAFAAAAQERRTLLGRRNGVQPAAVQPAAAAEAADTKIENEPGKINIDGAPLDAVLAYYGDLVGRTVLKDPKCPEVKITLRSNPGQELTDAERIDALETLLERNGVHLENYGERFVYAEPRKSTPNTGDRKSTRLNSSHQI